MDTSLSARVLQADLREVVASLSDALDLVGIDDVAHGKRVGIMAAECGRAAGFDDNEVTYLFDLGMLHDIGVSSTATHHHLVSEFDWSGSQTHCRVGHELLAGFPPLASMADAVLYHHTPWPQLSQNIDQRTARRANLVYLVDRVDALAAPHYANGQLLFHMYEIRDCIKERRGSYFSPVLVEVFLDASRSEAFWLNLEARSIRAYLRDMLARRTPYAATLPELRQLATIFSRIVDAKSPFTAAHSYGVARLARFLAQALGIDEENCLKIEVAGLLHDLGKLRIPDDILNKPAKLDHAERLVMNTHSFETFQILRQIRGFDEIAPWAAYHHEEPDGSGYPFHLTSAEMPTEARILRVADVFQAMAQDRPYRTGMSAIAIKDFLHDMVRQGRLDSRIVACACRDITAAMSEACSSLPLLH